MSSRRMTLLVDDLNRLAPSASLPGLEAATRAASWNGFDVYHIEPDFSRCETAEAALCNVPEGESRQAVWLGYIPTPERYAEIYRAAKIKGQILPNTPEEHARVTEMEFSCPALGDLTPATAIARSWEECLMGVATLEFPLFVKGNVQSLKGDGWKACVADNLDELKTITERLFRSSAHSRGKVILRKLLKLRSKETTGLGAPIGREYRLFCYRGEILTRFYYWRGDDPFGTLTDEETRDIEALAQSALQRLEVPYCSLDLGQDEDGRWWVIETADGQFSGMDPRCIPEHWHRFARRLHEESLCSESEG